MQTAFAWNVNNPSAAHAVMKIRKTYVCLGLPPESTLVLHKTANKKILNYIKYKKGIIVKIIMWLFHYAI